MQKHRTTNLILYLNKQWRDIMTRATNLQGERLTTKWHRRVQTDNQKRESNSVRKCKGKRIQVKKQRNCSTTAFTWTGIREQNNKVRETVQKN